MGRAAPSSPPLLIENLPPQCRKAAPPVQQQPMHSVTHMQRHPVALQQPPAGVDPTQVLAMPGL
eukprot:6832678-Alexandrium_andersonii.AAC.1